MEGCQGLAAILNLVRVRVRCPICTKSDSASSHLTTPTVSAAKTRQFLQPAASLPQMARENRADSTARRGLMRALGVCSEHGNSMRRRTAQQPLCYIVTALIFSPRVFSSLGSLFTLVRLPNVFCMPSQTKAFLMAHLSRISFELLDCS